MDFYEGLRYITNTTYVTGAPWSPEVDTEHFQTSFFFIVAFYYYYYLNLIGLSFRRVSLYLSSLLSVHILPFICRAYQNFPPS